MSKFNTLNNPDADLTNGRVNIRGKTLRGLNLLPGLPLKSDANQTIFSQKIEQTDLDFPVLTTPYAGTIEATDFETADYFVNQSLQTIENFSASTQLPNVTNISGLTKSTEVATSRVYDPGQQTFIELDGTDVSVSANDLKLNGSSVMTGANLTSGKVPVAGAGGQLTDSSLAVNSSGGLNVQSGFLANQSIVLGFGTGFNRLLSLDTNTQSGLGALEIACSSLTVPAPISTNQTTFAANNLVTKQYVDGSGGGGNFVSTTDLNPQQMDGALTSLVSLEAKGLIASNVSTTQQTVSYIKSTANTGGGAATSYTFKNLNGQAFGLYKGDETSQDAIWGYDVNGDYVAFFKPLEVPPITATSAGNSAANKSYVDSVVPTVFKGSAGATQTVYEDDKVRFIWDGGNKQPKYLVKVAPASLWVDGGIQLTHEPLTQEFITEVDDLSIAISTEFYFTTSGSRNAAFDMSNYGNFATTWLCAEDDTTYPTYYIKWFTGNVTSTLTAVVEKY